MLRNTISIISTTNLGTLTGNVYDPWGEWAVTHLETSSSADEERMPTNHGGIFQNGEVYRIIINSEIENFDSATIDTVAEKILAEIGQLSLAQQIEKARLKAGIDLSDAIAYQIFLNHLADTYNREEINVLQAEVTRIEQEKIQLAIGRSGDLTDLIIVDRDGNVCSATVNNKLHPTSTKVELICIKIELIIKEAFLIACSANLTNHLRKDDGCIDRDRFRYAILTGQSLLPEEISIPLIENITLTPAIISDRLQNAARHFAVNMPLAETKMQGSTTVISLAIPNIPQPLEMPCSSSEIAYDSEEAHYQAFEAIFEQGNLDIQISYLEKLAKVARNKKEFFKAAHLLNGALAIAKNQERRDSLFAKLELVQSDFFESLFSFKPSPQTNQSIQDYRTSLMRIRNGASTRIAQEEPSHLVQGWLSKKYTRFLCKLLQDSIDLIGGEPPTSYAIVGLDSLASAEVLPYSEIKFAILTNKRKHIDYFKNLVRFLELRLINLGETEHTLFKEAVSFTHKGLRMNFGGIITFKKVRILTPQILTHDPILKKPITNNSELPFLNETIQPVYLMGDPTFFDHWINRKKGKVLKKPSTIQKRQDQAIRRMGEKLKQFSPYLENDQIVINALEANRDLFTPIHVAIRGLLLFHGLKSNNTMKGIECLRKEKIICSSGAENLKKALQIAIKLRMQTQLFYQKEDERFQLEGKQSSSGPSGLMILNNPTIILEAYQILTALHTEMLLFVQHPKRSLFACTFYNEIDCTAARPSYRRPTVVELNYQSGANSSNEMQGSHESVWRNEESLKALQKQHGMKPHTEVAGILHTLGNDHKNAGNLSQAIDYYEQSLNMTRAIHDGHPHPEIAKILDDLSFIFLHLEQPDQAIEYSEESLTIKQNFFKEKSLYKITKNYNYLGGAYLLLKNSKRAIFYFNESYKIMNALFKDNPRPQVAETLRYLGRAHKLAGDFNQAIICFEKSVSMAQSFYSVNPDDATSILIGNNFNEFGQIYRRINQPMQAIEYFHKTLALFQNQGPHLIMAQSLNYIGASYRELGDGEQSIAFCQRSLQMKLDLLTLTRKKILYKSYEIEIAFTLGSLSKGYQLLGDHKKALAALEQSYHIYKTHRGENHMATQKTKANLENLQNASSL
ncbi:MAG: tetratricopeptide repeat protein [Chlamydiales bacterium]